MKRYIYNKTVLLSVLILLFFISSTEAQVVKINPATQTVNAGSHAIIKVYADNFTGLKAYSIKINYDVSVVKGIEVNKLEFLNGAFSTFFFSDIDTTDGQIQVDEAILGTGTVTGSGELFEIKFIGVQAGTTPLTFFETDLRNINNQPLPNTFVGGELIVSGTTGVDNQNSNPASFILYNNYPNPFNPSTNISFLIEKAGQIELKVYDLLGKEVAVLLNEYKTAGSYEINFNAGGLSSGVYFYELKSGRSSKRMKMMLTK